MEASWEFWTAITLWAWGLWGFFSGVAERHLHVMTVFAWHTIGLVACAAVGLPFCGLTLPAVQICLSLLAGIGYAQGAVWMVDSISAGGPAGVVVTVSAMYPVVVLVLNMCAFQILPSLLQSGGMVVAVASILCFLEHSEESGHAAPAPLKWLGSSILSLLAYAVWTFVSELCVSLPTEEPLPSTAQGSRLIWQAFGCALACLLYRPSLTRTSDADGCCIDPILCNKSQDCGGDTIASALLLAEASPGGGDAAVCEKDGDSAAVFKWAVLGAVAMGISMAVGAAGFVMAVQVAPKSVLNSIVMTTDMYMVITVLMMRVFMNERISIRRYCGVALAILACVLLA